MSYRLHPGARCAGPNRCPCSSVHGAAQSAIRGPWLGGWQRSLAALDPLGDSGTVHPAPTLDTPGPVSPDRERLDAAAGLLPSVGDGHYSADGFAHKAAFIGLASTGHLGLPDAPIH